MRATNIAPAAAPKRTEVNSGWLKIAVNGFTKLEKECSVNSTAAGEAAQLFQFVKKIER
jgi:hypothetical protein